MNQAAPESSHAKSHPTQRSRLPLVLLLVVCIAPVIASYATYYWIKPAGRTNYGELVSPQRDMSALMVNPIVVPDPIPGERQLPVVVGKPVALGAWRGRWVMAVARSTPCDELCRDQLYKIRQVRLTTGKHRNRVERLWINTGEQLPSNALLDEHDGLWIVTTAKANAIAALPAPQDSQFDRHIYLIDPLGNLMMRFPVNADPNRLKKDLIKLLKASRIG